MTKTNNPQQQVKNLQQQIKNLQQQDTKPTDPKTNPQTNPQTDPIDDDAVDESAEMALTSTDDVEIGDSIMPIDYYNVDIVDMVASGAINPDMTTLKPKINLVGRYVKGDEMKQNKNDGISCYGIFLGFSSITVESGELRVANFASVFSNTPPSPDDAAKVELTCFGQCVIVSACKALVPGIAVKIDYIRTDSNGPKKTQIYSVILLS